jgi:hypothetical protein
MPAPLRLFYDVIQRWPDAIVSNVVLAPPELPHLRKEAWAHTSIDDGRLTFYVENQGVCKWGTSPEEVDEARVWIRGSTLGGEIDTWALEEPPLSAFLIQLVVFEAVVGATHGASVAWLDRSALARVVEPLHRLPFGAWRWPSYPTEFYAGDRIWHSSDRPLVLTRRLRPRSTSASLWAQSTPMRSSTWTASPNRTGSGSRGATDGRLISPPRVRQRAREQREAWSTFPPADRPLRTSAAVRVVYFILRVNSCVCGLRCPSFLALLTLRSFSFQIVSPRVMSDS